MISISIVRAPLLAHETREKLGPPPATYLQVVLCEKLTLGQNRGTFMPTAEARACVPSGAFVRATFYRVTNLLAR